MISDKLRSILTVDDNPLNRFLITTIVNKIVSDCTMLEAENGYDALESFKSLKPDLIFMDIKLPDMNGFEVIQHIRTLEIQSRTPIVVVSANQASEENHLKYDNLIDAYLEKPIRFNELKLILDKIFH
ncbi:response regulator [Leeuwenhoekiella polynyae]|uniref:Response regulator receiver domain-containing protein n=1 Tax=Leeuwenhoekiella polynyae TaxID=1550906 RepID=A0A4Q0PH26_9FLAO|nr:response regulator [Leeuwenhoekiella polynyae]RXG26257.1 response regulator receiver domain-containing protein [Leeuwenhoekiella polynyae]